MSANERREYETFEYVIRACGSLPFDCKDPEAPTDCPTPSPAASYATSTTYYLGLTNDDASYYAGCQWWVGGCT